MGNWKRSCTAFWPLLVALFAVSAWAALALARGMARGMARGRWIALLLAAHWFWSGAVFHLVWFSRINPAARLFGAAFLMQSALFAAAARRGRLSFDGRAPSPRRVAGLAFLLASVLYPVLVAIDGHPLPAAPAYGVPCPTLLFTTGALLTATGRVPRHWLIIPVGWSIVGGSAAWVLGMTPDLLLLAAGCALVALALRPGPTRGVPDRLARNGSARLPIDPSGPAAGGTGRLTRWPAANAARAGNHAPSPH